MRVRRVAVGERRKQKKKLILRGRADRAQCSSWLTATFFFPSLKRKHTDKQKKRKNYKRKTTRSLGFMLVSSGGSSSGGRNRRNWRRRRRGRRHGRRRRCQRGRCGHWHLRVLLAHEGSDGGHPLGLRAATAANERAAPRTRD
jgi:hypothetical protein